MRNPLTAYREACARREATCNPLRAEGETPTEYSLRMAEAVAGLRAENRYLGHILHISGVLGLTLMWMFYEMGAGTF
jgi:hypothetical protein